MKKDSPLFRKIMVFAKNLINKKKKGSKGNRKDKNLTSRNDWKSDLKLKRKKNLTKEQIKIDVRNQNPLFSSGI